MKTNQVNEKEEEEEELEESFIASWNKIDRTLVIIQLN